MQEEETKRRHIRFRWEGVAEMTTAEGTAPLAGTILDLSREGCLFLLKHPLILAEATVVTVTFTLNRQRFQIAGVVRSQRESTRIGIRFDDTSARIGRHLGTLTASRTTGRAGRGPMEQEPLSPENTTAAVDKESGAPTATDGQTGS